MTWPHLTPELAHRPSHHRQQAPAGHHVGADEQRRVQTRGERGVDHNRIGRSQPGEDGPKHEIGQHLPDAEPVGELPQPSSPQEIDERHDACHHGQAHHEDDCLGPAHPPVAEHEEELDEHHERQERRGPREHVGAGGVVVNQMRQASADEPPRAAVSFGGQGVRAACRVEVPHGGAP